MEIIINLRNALVKACNFGLILTGLAFLITSTSIAADQGLTAAPIIDPAYNLKAFTITIPAGWKFQGTVIPGPECSGVPYPVFRAYSPDGLNEIRLEPTFNWTFHLNLRMKTPRACLDFGHSLTAEEFLKRYEEMIASSGLHVVGPMPIAPSYQRRVDGVAQNKELGSRFIRLGQTYQRLPYWRKHDALNPCGMTQIRHLNDTRRIENWMHEHHPGVEKMRLNLHFSTTARCQRQWSDSGSGHCPLPPGGAKALHWGSLICCVAATRKRLNAE